MFMICAAYTASVTSFYKMRYFLEHVYEPFQHSMTWTLDYSRASDVHDTIGYWHVEAIETGSRVTYTQTTMLPAWIPNAIKKTFTKVAMNAAVSQLEPAALATLEKEQKAGGGARNSASAGSRQPALHTSLGRPFTPLVAERDAARWRTPPTQPTPSSTTTTTR